MKKKKKRNVASLDSRCDSDSKRIYVFKSVIHYEARQKESCWMNNDTTTFNFQEKQVECLAIGDDSSQDINFLK